MALMFQVVFWVVMLCSVAVEYQRFRGPCCLHLQVGILPQHYMASQLRRPQFEVVRFYCTPCPLYVFMHRHKENLPLS
jgi:hypothetical protein